MGCFGDSEQALFPTAEQKWEYLTLSDFKSTSCLAPLSYVWLWILVVISVAVYAADAFTAVNLLAFDTWTGEVKPKVPFDVAKWIFAVCIILSYVFLAYRWFRAWRVLRTGSVTESYLEPLAAIFNSLRLTSTGKGWRRFLVYAQLTKSRKGVDYLALFVYFQFKGALLIILAQGPRMAINGLTLWAVMQAQIIPVGDHAAPKDQSPFVQFFKNIETMAKTGNKRETVIYFTMLFSLVIWVIAALSLIVSVILYLLFLWHYVPNSDGTLSNYCRRKMEARLERIVSKTARKAAEKEELKRKKKEEKAMRKGELPKPGFKDDDASSVISNTTMATLPPYPGRSNTTSTTATARTASTKPSFASVNQRPIPSRSDTGLSYASDAHLLSEAGSMGMASPVPPMPSQNQTGDYFRDGPGPRPAPGMAGRPFSPLSQQQRGPLPPLNTYQNGRVSPSSQLITPLSNDSPGQREPPYPLHEPQLGNPTFSPYDHRGPLVGPSYEMSPVEVSPLADVLQHYDSTSSNDSNDSEMPTALRPGPSVQQQGVNSTFAAYQPMRAGTAPPNNPRAGIPATLQSAIQRREAAQPFRGPNGMVQQRSATAPLQQGQALRSNTTTPSGAAYRRDVSQPLPYRGPNGLMQQQRSMNAPQPNGWEGPYPRSDTVGPDFSGYRGNTPQPLPTRGPNGMISQSRGATIPPEQPAYGQGPYPRSNTAGPDTRGYDGLDFSHP